MPQEIEFVDSLPKTRSGKIMRRLLRAKEWGEEIGDTSTLKMIEPGFCKTTKTQRHKGITKHLLTHSG